MFRLRRGHGLLGLGAIATLALAAPALAGGGDDSVNATLHASGADVDIEGTGCGIPASATLTLPAGASAVQVHKPVIGARNDDARLTDVSVQGNAVTFTAVGDGSDVCGGDPSVPWSLDFDAARGQLDVTFSARVSVLYFDDQFGGLHDRPGKVSLISLLRARHLRWKRFGGSTAVGRGALFGAPHTSGPVKVILQTPSYCPGGELNPPGQVEDPVIYRKVVFIGLDRRRTGIARDSHTTECDPSTGKHPTRLP